MSGLDFWSKLENTMTGAEQRELLQTMNYLTEVAYRPDGRSPEGSAAAIINKQSPAVRQAFAVISEVLETPRTRPFTEKWTEGQNAEEMGLHPETTTHIKSALDGQYVAHQLQERMGTDADTPTSNEPDTRDILSAAYDLHTQGAENG